MTDSGRSGANAWRAIDTAPPQRTIIVGDDGPENVALAHEWHGTWFLGPMEDSGTEALDFEPKWWLPRTFKTNPFKLRTPPITSAIEAETPERPHP